MTLCVCEKTGTVINCLMLFNRLQANTIPTEPALSVEVKAPRGTSKLRIMFRAALTVPLRKGKNLGEIMIEWVWPHVLGAPDQKVVARMEYEEVKGRGGSGGGGGGGRKKKKGGKGKTKKGGGRKEKRGKGRR